ncbi:indoleamine 2,3-dioxygenase [Durotheca rogersii]|uniref:indoleamine 2,3-dioxygenase n=1 Tax=Durotheca rogersii TaxID=419775 RepID=UPI00221EF0C3|nr:indoleamine 2,3-dioxygenase [Durotheca rogersii]KAI5867389.1 indoleamine 2,3-dioxygenase [Durotheca rogersii]
MPGRTQPSSGYTDSSIEYELFQTYSVSTNGFLPAKEPLRRLSSSYYAPWESTVEDLPSLLREGTLRKAVDDLETLSTSKLRSEEEWRRAYVVLSFLAHGYIWGGEKPSEVLPRAVSVPFLQVSKHLELPPVATYAGLNLWNFKSTGSDFRDLDKLEALHTFTGTVDESWFYVVSVAMEAEGGTIIPVLFRALEAARNRDYSTVIKALGEATACIGKLGQLLDRMDEKCDPTVFYHQIRPFLAGSKNMGVAGLPNGVLYQDKEGRTSWKQLRGGSNGQSSLIQFLDVALGVEHTSTGGGSRIGAVMPQGGRGATPGFHEEVRSYMPAPHREFLQHVSRMGSLKELANEPAVSEEQRQLQVAFQVVTKALGDFRNRHMRIVSRYIVVPSRKQTRNSTVNLATASSRGSKPPGEELTGTGGTALIPFLKRTRDETYLAGVLAPDMQSEVRI